MKNLAVILFAALLAAGCGSKTKQDVNNGGTTEETEQTEETGTEEGTEEGLTEEEPVTEEDPMTDDEGEEVLDDGEESPE